jgi:hypothetical protein
MTILLIAGVVLLALWLVETIVFTIAYRRTSRAAPGRPDAASTWRSRQPKDGRSATSASEGPAPTQTAILS